MLERFTQKLDERYALKLISAFLLGLILGYLPLGSDWNIFRNAALTMFSGQNPYQVNGFYSPPWLLIPLLPFALLPYWMGVMVLTGFSAAGYYAAASQFTSDRIAKILLLVSFPVFSSIHWINSDVLVLLGIFLPPQLGLFLVLLKPQLGAGITLYWLLEAWQAGRWRQVVKIFTPVTVAYLLSFLIFGFYPQRWRIPINTSWDKSFFPYLIPIGIYLLILGIRSRSWRLLLPSAPLLSPYLSSGSWSVVLFSLADHKYWLLAANLFFWLLALFEFFQVW